MVDTIGLYWRQVRVYKISFFVMLISIPLAAVILDTVVPYFLSQAIGALAAQQTNMITQSITLAGIAAFVGVAFNLLGFQCVVVHEGKVRKSLVRSTMEQLLAKDAGFFANQKIGSLTSKFIDFINGHVELQDLFILRTLSIGISLATGIVLIALQAPLLALIIVGLIVALVVQIKVSRRLRAPLREQRKTLLNEINGASADIITNNVTVKTFAQEAYELTKLDTLTSKFKKAYITDLRWLSVEGSTRIFITNTVQIGAIILVASMVTAQTLSLSIAIFSLTYLQRLTSNLFVLGEILNGYDRIFLRTTPMVETLLEQPTVTDQPAAKPLNVTNGAIELRNVVYAYADNKQTQVLQALNITVQPDSRIGLIGTSGAGKTTLTKLLLRFDDVDSGEILIDHQNIADVTQASLRSAIAYVPQEPLLFHRSLRENIAYARPDASDDDIREAARTAYALDFIEKLPDGFATIVGERGVKLSGGQRQRIAIARAILKDAPILLLDEATSALDSESEKLIQNALTKLMKNRTSIVVAHRLSTIAKLDRIIVLDNGQIVEDGSHKQLLHTGGIYAKLWQHQSGGFIDS